MAFIRWKKNKLGTQQAQLVHSYRDEQGRPRQKVLAHLGADPTLTPELLSELQARHGHLPIKWDQIAPAPAPKRRDISRMSDEELLSNLRILRREHGIGFREMAFRLHDHGLRIGTFAYSDLERQLHKGENPRIYKDPLDQLAIYVRKVLCSA